jgi:hypothetical protein
MQSARVKGLWWLPPRFQWKAYLPGNVQQGWVACRQHPEKPKLQWRLEEARDARNVVHLLRKARGREHSQSKTEAIWAPNSKALGEGLPKTVGVHIMTLSAMNIGHGSTGCNVYLTKFQSWFGNVYSLPLLS